MSSSIRKVVASALVGLGLWVVPAGAGEPVYLEVRLLPVAVVGCERTWDVTPVLKFDSPEAARRACTALPSVVEAFVRDLASPVAAAKTGGGPDLAALAARLNGRAAAVLGAGAPKRVHLALGTLHPADFRDGNLGFPMPRQCADLGAEPAAAPRAKPTRVPSGNGAR